MIRHGRQTAEIICFVDAYINYHLDTISNSKHLQVLEYFARAEQAQKGRFTEKDFSIDFKK